MNTIIIRLMLPIVGIIVGGLVGSNYGIGEERLGWMMLGAYFGGLVGLLLSAVWRLRYPATILISSIIFSAVLAYLTSIFPLGERSERLFIAVFIVPPIVMLVGFLIGYTHNRKLVK